MAKSKRKFQRIAIPVMSLAYHLYYKLHITGRENIPEGPCVVCPNHKSVNDPPLAAVALTGKNSFGIMAKKELFEGKFFGMLIRGLGAFPVDRERADITAIKTALQIVKSGEKFIIFPQGTRDSSENDTKEGAAMIASRTKAPILPIFISEKKHRFAKVNVVIGKPFYPESDAKDYTGIANEIIKKIYELDPERV